MTDNILKETRKSDKRQVHGVEHQFFFKQKTAYDMAQCDWSSDVCSSDLPQVRRRLAREESEQGALPRAVRADEGDLVPRVEEEVRVLEDERGAPGLPEVPARDDRLHVRGASPLVPDEASLRPLPRRRNGRRFIHDVSVPTAVP